MDVDKSKAPSLGNSRFLCIIIQVSALHCIFNKALVHRVTLAMFSQ